MLPLCVKESWPEVVQSGSGTELMKTRYGEVEVGEERAKRALREVEEGGGRGAEECAV